MNYTVRNLNFDEVRNVLDEEGYESILSHIVEDDGKYILNASASDISSLPSYHYALGITLMALGNSNDAERICGNVWRFLGRSGQTDVTYILGRYLALMYSKSE